MKKQVVLILIFMVSVFTSTSHIQPPNPDYVIAINVEDEWNIPLEGATNSCDIVECSSGGYAALCMNRTLNGLVLFRVNSNGSIRWIRDIQSSIPLFGNALVECEFGGFAILATRDNFRRMFIIRTDADGNTQWIAPFSDGYGYSVEATVERIAFDFVEYNEGFAVVGSHVITRSTSWTYSFLVLLNESVDRVFRTRWYTRALHTSIEKTEDGFIISLITGPYYLPRYSVLYKLDFDGRHIWASSYSANSEFETVKFIHCSVGGFAITGKTYGGDVDNTKGMFGTTGSSGEMISLLAIGGNVSEQFFDLVETPDGGFILVGESDSYTNDSLTDAFMVRVDSEGQYSWARRLLPKRVRGRITNVLHSVDGTYILCGDFWSSVDGLSTPWMFKIVDLPPESPLVVTVTDILSPWTPPSTWTWSTTTTWTTWTTTSTWIWDPPPPPNWWVIFVVRITPYIFTGFLLSLPVIQTLLQRRSKSKMLAAQSTQGNLEEDKGEDWC